MAGEIKRIHDALLTLHKEFDVLNKENERINGIVDGMEDKLKELKRERSSHPTALPVKVPKKKPSRKKKPGYPPKLKVPKPAVATVSSGNGSKPAFKSPVTKEEIERVLAFAKDGKLTQREIGEEIGRSQTVVSQILRRAGISRKNHPVRAESSDINAG